VAAASGGNHGAAVAYAARRLGHPATIFVPSIASPAKLAVIRDQMADVTVAGERYADALALCEAHQAATGAISIHAYDAAATIAGQGTVAAEWEEDTGGIDTILVAVGGGGLISGIAAWFGGRVKVVGVEPEEASALHAALVAGEPVDVSVDGVAADSLGAKRTGALNLAKRRHTSPRWFSSPTRRSWMRCALSGRRPASRPSRAALRLTRPSCRARTLQRPVSASGCSSAAPTSIRRSSRRSRADRADYALRLTIRHGARRAACVRPVNCPAAGCVIKVRRPTRRELKS